MVRKYPSFFRYFLQQYEQEHETSFDRSRRIHPWNDPELLHSSVSWRRRSQNLDFFSFASDSDPGSGGLSEIEKTVERITGWFPAEEFSSAARQQQKSAFDSSCYKIARHAFMAVPKKPREDVPGLLHAVFVLTRV